MSDHPAPKRFAIRGWFGFAKAVARALNVRIGDRIEIVRTDHGVLLRRVGMPRRVDVAPAPQPIAVVIEHAAAPAQPDPIVPGAAAREVPVVLVVDDSAVVRKVAQRLIEREGWDCIVAADGVDALGQLQRITPSVMLIDIEMPRMDGLTFTREVRAMPHLKHIPAIVISSYAYDNYREAARVLGIEVYLTKPYDARELVSQVRKFLASTPTV